MQVLLILKLLYQRKTLIKILRNIQHHHIEVKLCQGQWVMILVDFQVGLFLKDPDSASLRRVCFFLILISLQIPLLGFPTISP